MVFGDYELVDGFESDVLVYFLGGGVGVVGEEEAIF